MFSHVMPERSRGRFTLGEVAVLAGVDEKAARHALNDVLGKPAGSFGVRDVVFFVMRTQLLSLTDSADVQRALYVRLHERSARLVGQEGLELCLKAQHSSSFRVVVEPYSAARQVLARILAFREGSRRVVRSDDVQGGALVFKGTRIPVAHVGALVKRGVPVEQLREDFPQLKPQDFEFARMLVEMNPPRGRPRKRIEFRRR